jgi:hypothetical protein
MLKLPYLCLPHLCFVQYVLNVTVEWCAQLHIQEIEIGPETVQPGRLLVADAKIVPQIKLSMTVSSISCAVHYLLYSSIT